MTVDFDEVVSWDAVLTRATGTKVTLQTDKGKLITLNQSELAPESFKRVQEITRQSSRKNIDKEGASLRWRA